MLLKEVIEALIFASQKPLTVKEIVAALRSALDDSDEEPVRAMSKLKEAEVTAFLEQVQGEYQNENRAFQLVEQVSGWAIVTKPEYAVWVRQLYPESKPTRLSGPALETLAIIAYRQPVTRADIEVVRGVAVDGVMQSLLERGLVRIAGRAEVPGRPLLYETTQVFMQHFGLRNLEELPNVNELRKVRLPSATPATTGGLFAPDAPDAAAPAAESPATDEAGASKTSAFPSGSLGTSAPGDASSELPPVPEPDLTGGGAESVPAEPPSPDHVADPNS